MPRKTITPPKKKKAVHKTLRFAHPFFTAVPPASRPVVPGVGKQMTDYIQNKLLPFPAPQRNTALTLDEIIGSAGAAEIAAAGRIRFHSIGDTGHENGLMQELVAAAMITDYDIAHPVTSPAFLLHLGDVIYYDNTDKGYQSQFYIPYKKYPGKIIAIPGNHDGELFKFDGTPTGQKVTLAAFQRNFCQPKPGVPPDAGTIYREMVSQPGVYWYLDAPLVDIVGLYSNIGEGPGFISGSVIGQSQKDWLIKTLTTIAKSRNTGARKALVLAVHHPLYSEGGHSASDIMLADIDDACKKANILPDAVLTAHAHNYQRFTRYVKSGTENWQIPYFVVGTGGRGSSPVKAANGKKTGDVSYDASYMGYGYLTIDVTAKNIVFNFTQVDAAGKKSAFDKTITVDLKTHHLV
ncbi:metallophosphoesterase family protein [Chitinophaga niastensis]|nr:metallophosphoesterase [Chitinophaga niastensis]